MIVVPPYYLSAEDYETLKLIADIIIPGNGPDEPGASAVGTVNFIDSEFGNMSENEREYCSDRCWRTWADRRPGIKMPD